MARLIKVTLKRSLSKCTAQQLGTLQGLGLRKRHHHKILRDLKEVRGMVLSVQHMIDILPFEGDESLLDSQRLRAKREGTAS